MLPFLELGIVFGLIVLFVSQVYVPLFSGEKLFPLLTRRKKNKILWKMEEVEEIKEIKTLETKLKEMEKEI